MLSLGSGARRVTVGAEKSIFVFPDFSDRNQFYYLPGTPHIAKMEDGTPAIRLLVYREDLDSIDDDDEEAVAFLSLDVEVGWPADLLDEAARKIRNEDELDDKPKLTPIFFRDGAVKLMLLDAVTPEVGEDPEQPTAFVTKIMGTGSPSLYGDNRAIFQATLSKKGAAALSGALDGVTPIGIVYTLTFAGLQPAFNIRASVDWHKVYDHFSEKKGVDLLFYESEIENSIDKLEEDQVIKYEVTVEGIGAEAMDASREEVEKSVRQLIFDQFFEATFQRVDPAGGGTANDVADAVNTVVEGASIIFGMGYSYKRKEVRIEELRTLNLDWTARRAAERTLYPQAHMHNLLKDGGINRDQLITIVDGSDDIWRNQPILVNTTAAWEPDGIKGITVDLEYNDADSGDLREWGTFLDKATPEATHRDWMDRTSGNNFRYKYEVVFQDEGVPGPSSKVSSGEDWLDFEGAVLVINPRNLYESIELDVGTVPGFDFTRWPAVQAIIRYRTEDESFVHYEDGVLTSADPSFKTRFRVNKDVQGIREVRMTYIGASGERVETEWMPMYQDQWVVVDPHDNELTVLAMVAGNRKNIANLVVNLEYADPDAGIHETGLLQFSSDDIDQPQTWTVHLADPTKRRYRYRMTLITKEEGDFIQTGWIGTDAPTLPIGEIYVRTLTVELATGELAANIESVKVKLEYHDDMNDFHPEKEFTLGANSHAEWQVKLKDASNRNYQVTTTWVSTDGFNKTAGPKTESKTYLIIPGSPD